MLRDVTYTFWSENRVQDCAVRPVAVAAGRRKVIRPVIMAMGQRSKRSKVKGHVGTAIQQSYLGRNQAALWPRRCAPRSGFPWSGPHPHAGLLISTTVCHHVCQYLSVFVTMYLYVQHLIDLSHAHGGRCMCMCIQDTPCWLIKTAQCFTEYC